MSDRPKCNQRPAVMRNSVRPKGGKTQPLIRCPLFKKRGEVSLPNRSLDQALMPKTKIGLSGGWSHDEIRNLSHTEREKMKATAVKKKNASHWKSGRGEEKA